MFLYFVKNLFLKKKNIIIWGISLLFIWLFLLGMSALFLKEKGVIFLYPDADKINFSWEVMPIDSKHFYVKERFDKEFIVNSNTLYQFYLYIKRYPLYIPYIEKVLKESGIPQDFKYLPIAESALRNDVVSHAGAAGIWQFIPETAKRYGLRVDEFVDERYNFEKSTSAASKYLSDLHAIFWNWTLVAAAYNRWENWLKRELDEQGVKSYYDLYLNEETSRYIFRILAIKYMIEGYFSQKWVLDFVIWGTYEIPKTTEIEVHNSLDNLVLWSQQNGQSFNTVKILNPWILKNALPEWKWTIKILAQ